MSLLDVLYLATGGVAIALTANALLSAIEHSPREATLMRASAAVIVWLATLILFSLR